MRAKRRLSLNRITELKKAIFRELLVASVERNDPLQELASVVVHVTVGHVGPSASFLDSEGVPYLRTGNIGHGELLFDNMLRVSPKFHGRLKKSQLKSGDVLFSRHISDEIRCAIVPATLGEANCANMIVIRPGPGILPEYLLNLITDESSQNSLLRRQVGTAQAVINTKVVQSWVVPIPPIEVQEALQAKMRSLTAMQKLQWASMKSIDGGFSSLQFRAFRGEL